MKRKTKKTAAGGGALRLLVRILYCVVPSAIVATCWMWAWPIAVVFGIGMFWLGWQVTKPMPERGETSDYGDDYHGQIERMAKHIHYPECWDTMAYPTLADAVCEITECDPNQCTH